MYRLTAYVAPTVSLPPLSYAIARCNPSDPGLQRCLVDLLSHPKLGANLRTPGTTALGHTLLHIVCLPLTATQTVARNPHVARSIHSARTLDPKWKPRRLPIPLHMEFSTAESIGLGYMATPMTVVEQLAEQAKIKILVDWAGVDVRAKDVEGNTALHYLAGTLNMCEETIGMVRQMERPRGGGGGRRGKSGRNRKTATELLRR